MHWGERENLERSLGHSSHLEKELREALTFEGWGKNKQTNKTVIWRGLYFSSRSKKINHCVRCQAEWEIARDVREPVWSSAATLMKVEKGMEVFLKEACSSSQNSALVTPCFFDLVLTNPFPVPFLSRLAAEQVHKNDLGLPWCRTFKNK